MLLSCPNCETSSGTPVRTRRSLHHCKDCNTKFPLCMRCRHGWLVYTTSTELPVLTCTNPDCTKQIVPSSSTYRPKTPTPAPLNNQLNLSFYKQHKFYNPSHSLHIHVQAGIPRLAFVPEVISFGPHTIYPNTPNYLRHDPELFVPARVSHRGKDAGPCKLHPHPGTKLPCILLEPYNFNRSQHAYICNACFTVTN